MKKHVIFIFLSALFFYLGRMSKNADIDELPSSFVEEQQRITKIEKGLKEISENDLKEYLELKSQSDQFVKSNEILEKVFKMLLINLELKLSENQKKNIDKVSSVEPSTSSNCKKEPDKKSNIEVIVDPYSDDKIKLGNKIVELQKEVQTLKQSPKKKKIKNKLFEKFHDVIKNPRIDGDIRREQWNNAKPLSFDQLQEAQESFYTPYYLNTYEGLLRKGDQEYKIKVKLTQSGKKNADKNRLASISIVGIEHPLFIKSELKAYHSITHNSFGSGPCRAIVLHGKDEIQIHLIRLRNKASLLVRIYFLDSSIKETSLGNAYLKPVGSSSGEYPYGGKF